MDGLDHWWWAAPGPALRLMPGHDPAWRVNPAARTWAASWPVAEADWQRLADELSTALNGNLTDTLSGSSMLGSAQPGLQWVAVAFNPGWLVWLTPDAAECTRLAAQLDVVKKLGRMGHWQRNLRTGEGHWDVHMFALTGFDPAAGMPSVEQLLQRVHPDDRSALRHDNARFAQAAGRYATRYRLALPGGQLRDVHAVCEVTVDADGRPAVMSGLLIDETETATRVRRAEAEATQWTRAIDLAAVSVWRLNLVTNQAYFSDWGYRLLGIKAAVPELTVDDVRRLVHPDDRAAVLRAAEEAIATNRVVDVEARYRAADGGYRHLLTRRVAERDAAGNLVGLSGVSLDMTDRIAERDSARAYAERIDRVTNAAGVGIWSVDLETHAIEWNDQMYRLYGLPRDVPAPDGRHWLDTLVHPDDREIARHHRPVVGTGPQGRHAEFRIVRPDGSVRWVASWSRREALGGRSLAFGVNLDITDLHHTQVELRQAQERARLATESAGIGTWERDLRTGRAKWDAQMYRLRGLPVGPETPADDLRYAAYHPDDLAQIDRNKANAGRIGDGYQNEFRVVFPDGSIRWLTARGVVQRDASGQPERMLGVTWDVTEQRRAEQALRDKLAAERASQAKSQFLARMSHELRTPLNAVLGFAQLLGNDPGESLSARQGQRVERIHSAGLHLLALIDDVLDLATIESDALPLAQEPVSLQASLDDVMQWTHLQAAQAGVTVHAGSLTGCWVRADPRRVRQVLSNLLSNAIKYNRGDGGQVWVAVLPAQREGQHAWQLSVRDSGRGLSAEQRSQLFQPFNRLGAERGNIQGTGIGLAIVHHLVRLMGGEMSVRSEPGEGSDFRVTLLASPAPASADDSPLSAFHDDLRDAPVPASLSLLYIEDNPVNVLLVQELVAMRSDLRLGVAVDGLSGVAEALASRPQVVLVDMQLPDIDGFEVLRRLRAEKSLAGTTIVALSANAMPEDVTRARAAGFDDYWTKPIDFHAFLRALAELAQLHGG